MELTRSLNKSVANACNHEGTNWKSKQRFQDYI